MKSLIAVIGAGQCDDRIYSKAYDVGRHIAEKKFGLICGGLGGVMEAAAKGCRDAGGITVGIIPQEDGSAANPYIDIVIPTGMSIMRNLLIIRAAAGIVAVDGKYGTLSEIAYALQLKKPIVGLDTWDVSETIIKAQSAEEAVFTIVGIIGK
ncbi:MAG: TIGR00725 family protein [Calditrichaceae bacterium]